MNRKLEDFDEKFDRALSAYTPAQPRPGFEERILTAIATSEAARQKRISLRWSGLAVAVGAVLVVAVLVALKPAKHTADLATPAVRPSPAAQMDSHPENPTPVRSAGRRVAHGEREPRQETAMLAPAPEEALLAKFLSTHPAEALAFSAAQVKLEEPLRSHPIDLKPIQLKPISNESITIQPIAMDLASPTTF
jgi:hypothetical protein